MKQTFPSFDSWMSTVDAIVTARMDYSVHDLPDCLYADWYAAGVKPATAASRAIKAAKADM